MATGSGKLMEPDDVARELEVLRDYVAPDALGAVYQNAASFSRHSVKFDPHPEKSGISHAAGKRSPGGLCARHAPHPRGDE